MQIFRCERCGRIVEEQVEGRGPIICCGEEMRVLSPNEFPELLEEHRPRIYHDGGILVEVGAIPHEMDESNRIIWVEIVREDGTRIRRYLEGEKRPEASFGRIDGNVEVRILCSRHGLWIFEHKTAKLDLVGAVRKAVERFNELRGRESSARILEISDESIVVEFTGNFCRTCGFYDYFEDLRLLMEDYNVRASIKVIEEFEDGSIVTYSIERDRDGSGRLSE
jgi:superoxide reductase